MPGGRWPISTSYEIEILKGPASATYGSAAIGGIVSVSTLNPIDMLADERRFALRSRWRFSSDDHSGQGSALAARKGRRH